MTTGPTADEHAERFTLLRTLLFTIVYDHWFGNRIRRRAAGQLFRWANVDLATVRDSKSYLAQLVTRQALKSLRASARRRENYIGPWLPEPLLLDERDASADVVLAESVSMAMLVLLETLTPDERAVFVLREVFGFDYDEIAGAVGKSVAAVRQVAHRAREHVQARRRRFEPIDTATTAQITEQFMKAADTGDLEGLLSMLAPDATWITDSCGKATAGRNLVVVGARKVAAILVAIFRIRQRMPDVRLETANCNSAPAIAIYRGDHLEAVFLFEIIDGKITNFYAMAIREVGRDNGPADDPPLVARVMSWRPSRAVDKSAEKRKRVMRKPTAAIGSAVMFIVGPGLVIGVVPWLLTRWQFRDPTPYWAIFRVLGVLLILAGPVVLIQAFVRFVTEGFGTPLPVAAPQHLVVGGLYRCVRNPMYVAMLAVILGQALLFGQLGPLVYAAILWVRMASVVRWHEEPVLARRFGADYDVYRRAVPAWRPRLRPWTPTATPPQ